MRYSKFVIVISVTVLLSSTLLAQNPLKKGVYAVGGSVSLSLSKYNSDDDSYDKYTDIWISPSAGYFITDNIMLEGHFSFVYWQTEYSSKGSVVYKHISRSIEAGTGARYYFNAESVIPFAGISVSYSKSIGETADQKGVRFIAGVNYFLSKEVALEPYISYLLETNNRSFKSYTNFQFGVEINYYITE